MCENSRVKKVERDAGDFDEDGYVNDIDATLMASNWSGVVAGASVPELSSLLLAAFACLTLLLGARKSKRQA